MKLILIALSALTLALCTKAAQVELATKARQSSSFVQCAIQAFGEGLDDKGIRIEVTRPAFGCANPSTPDTLNKITKSAKFIGREAEILVSLPATKFSLCFLSMSIWATVPYSCSTLNRLITSSEWGFGRTRLGTCRALKQQCGSTVSNAAIPYIDMYCKRPSDSFGGRTEEMRLNWAFLEPDDKC